MRKKLKRGRKMFQKRRNVGKIVGTVLTVLLVPALVVAGYYAASYMMTAGPSSSSAPSEPTPESTAPTNGESSDPGPVSEPDTPIDPEPSVKGLRLFYLPVSALQNLDAWNDRLEAAVAAGYNGVLFDLKQADGQMRYVSATELAVAAQTASADALSLDELKAAADVLRSKGLTPVPRLHAFQDHLAAARLATAKITVAGSPNASWYDNDPSNGGKRWLNPYAADARRFITGLSAELKEAGFRLLMLDSVQFPNQTSSADFTTTEWASLSKGEVLTLFAEEMNEAVGKNGWMLAMPGLAAIGDGTGPFGGNPVTFGAGAVAPVLTPASFGAKLTVGTEKVTNPQAHPYDTVSLLLSQIQSRIGLMEEKPAVVPWIQASGYNAGQIAEEVRALTELAGADASYILYDANGQYSFT